MRSQSGSANQPVPSPTQLVAALDEVVVGQGEAKRVLAVALTQLLTRSRFDRNDPILMQLPPKRNVLLMGPSGCGKTLLTTTAAKLVNVPYRYVDATRLVPQGQQGLQIADFFEELIQDPADDPPVTAIVFLDEIDKLAMRSPGDPGELVQRSLLTALGGSQMSVTVSGRRVKVDTSGFLFVAAGAFEAVGPIGSLEGNVRRRLDEHPTFGYAVRRHDERSISRNWLEHLETEDLVQFGFLRELACRFPVREALHALGEQDLLHVLRDSPSSPLLATKQEAQLNRVAIEVKQEAMDNLVARALQRGGGARGLAAEWQKIDRRLQFDLPDLANKGIGKLIIDASTIEGGPPKQIKCNPLPGYACKPANQTQKPSCEAEVAKLFPKGSLPVRPPRAEGGVLGSSHWATCEDLATWLHPHSGEARPPTAWSGVTPIVEDAQCRLRPLLRQVLYLPDEVRRRHVFIVGKNGSGKTTRALLSLLANDLRERDKSVVVIDAQMELTPHVLRMVRKYRGPDARIVYFDPTNPGRSVAWNPLHKVRTPSQVRELMEALVDASPQSPNDSPFFRGEAARMLRYVTECLLKIRPGALNFGTEMDLTESVTTILRLAEEAKHAPLAEFANAVISGNHNSQSTLNEMQRLLACWADENVAACTQTSEFGFEELEVQPTVLIFATPEEKVAAMAPLRALFILDFFRFVMQRRRSADKPLRTIPLFVDEFASAVGRLPELDIRINTLRKNGLALVAAVQHLSQVYDVYGLKGKSVLAGFNTHILIPQLEPDDAEWAIKQSGTMTTEVAVSRFDPPAPYAVPVFRQEDVQGVPHPALGPRMSVFLPGAPPFQMYARASYESGEDDIFGKEAPKITPPDRPTPLTWNRSTVSVPAATVPATGLPPGITDTRGWSSEQIANKLEDVKQKIGWQETAGSARKFWEAFENENQHRPALILRLAEELASIDATITEFFLAYVYSNTDNIQANVYYVLYTRLKKEEERKKKEAIATARQQEVSKADSLDRTHDGSRRQDARRRCRRGDDTVIM